MGDFLIPANVISRKDPLGRTCWQCELEVPAGDKTTSGGYSTLKAKHAPGAGFRWVRFKRVTVALVPATVGTGNGIGITPLLFHSNQFSALYLPTQYTKQEMVVWVPGLAGSTTECTLEWECDFTTALGGAGELPIFRLYWAGEMSASDEIFVHIAAEVW